MANFQEVNILKQVYKGNKIKNLLAINRYYAVMFSEQDLLLTYSVVIDNGLLLEETKMPPPRRLLNEKSFPDILFSSKHPLMVSDMPNWLMANAVSAYTDFDVPPNSLMGAPLITGERVIGALVVENTQKNAYSSSDMNLFVTMAGQVTVAIENVRAYKRLQELHVKIAQTQEIITQNVIAQDFVHRINNLAGTIPIWIDLLKENLYPSDPRDEKIMEYLSFIEMDIDQLIDGAAELRRPIRDEKIDIRLLVESMLGQVKIQYPEIQCLQRITSDSYIIVANYFQLSSVIWNIISNALESMPELGSLTVNMQNIKDANNRVWLEIVVSDTGSGIPSNSLQKVFEPFYSTKGSGRGYGLWRSKSFIEGLGGRIHLTSEFQKGTTVVIVLPVIKQ